MTDQTRETMNRILEKSRLRFAPLESIETLTVIKDSPHRAVYRVQSPDLDLHIKHNRLLGWRSRIRESLRPSKARREYELARALRSRGISSPEPLAWSRDGLESWLVTRTAPGLPLLAVSRGNPALAIALGRWLAQLHAAGVIHRDLHPGNILVDFTADEPQFVLLDLHAVRLHSSCSWGQRRDNLVVFNRYFMLRASRSERSRFWAAYRSAAGDVIKLPAEQAGREIERLTLESNLAFWAARDSRCLESNRYYRRFSTGAMRGHAVRDLESFDTLLRDADTLLDEPRDPPLKNSRSATVIEIPVKLGSETVPAILKRFRIVDRRDPLLGLVRTTPALRSWVAGQGLRERMLPTARPLAVWHRRRNGLPYEGYLLTQKIENAVELRTWADQLLARPAAERRSELKLRLPALARLVRDLHTRGLSHRDLKAANILTSTAPLDARFWFIDLVGIRRDAGRRRIQNLARLNASFISHPLVSRTDKLRFLRAYLQWGLRGKGGWKTWWRRIAAATIAKQARNARNGRPLA